MGDKLRAMQHSNKFQTKNIILNPRFFAQEYIVPELDLNMILQGFNGPDCGGPSQRATSFWKPPYELLSI